MTRPAPLLALLVVLAVAGCSKKPAANALDAMDNELVNGSAVAEGPDSLRNAITVDPARDKAAPAAPKPAAASADAGAGTAGAGGGDCLERYGPKLVYSNGWAAKLPAELPVKPGAKLSEAAGHDGGCAVRVASFAVPGDREALLAWYEARARAAGYAAARTTRGSDILLAGDKGPARYTVIAGAPRDGATPVDLVWTRAD